MHDIQFVQESSKPLDGSLIIVAVVKPHSNIWFRSDINVGESTMENKMRKMCRILGLVQ